MAGGISAIARPRARPTPTWGGVMRRCSSTCCAAKASRSRIRSPMFPNPPGLLRLEPHSEGLRERIWWGAGSNATAVWAAKLGMNLQSSTLKNDETGEPFHVQQAAQIRAYRAAWKEAGHAREPRVSVSRSIFALIDDRDRAYFGTGGEGEDQVGIHRREDARDLRPQLRRRAGRPDRAAQAGRSHRRGRHPAADRAQPVGRCLQCACDRSDSDPRRARVGVALTKRVARHQTQIMRESCLLDPVVSKPTRVVPSALS